MHRLLCWCALAFTCSIGLAADRPNVVVILTDNHGAWTLGCYGNPDIRTPNIDRLADEGVLFTRAFASNPVCSPTRATLLTGLVPSQHGVHSFLTGGNLQTGPKARNTLEEFTSMPEILRQEGYACGLVGKWHLGANMSPQEGLDDYWITMPHGGTSTFYGANVIEGGAIRKEPTYLTDFWTEHAVKFINQRAEEMDKPFFLYLAYNGPYALSRLLLREGQNRHASHYADQELLSFPRETPHPWQLNNLDFINNPTSIRRVATEVSGVDDGVGEVMQALQQHGLDENTIVIFVADQGWVGGHGGFFGMGDHTRPLTARDGMMQIPLIWRHPQQVAAGVRSDRMIANYDILPTLLGHLGMADKMPSQPPSPGKDLSSLLQKDAEGSGTPDDAIFYEFENLRCIRTTTHKYVHRHPNGPHELYDLRKDPDEFNNLVNDDSQAGRRKMLQSRLNSFYKEHSLPKYDMWHGGTSQVRIHDGIDEELAQLASVSPPDPPGGFKPAPIEVPDGYSVELAAGPPLVTHPTMGCFDDQGRLYVCNNSGVNLSNKELEEELPNAIHLLVDADQDGRFDSSTVFADKMTFPMGGAWHNGSLYVASPPNIWKLTDTDDDGVADEREVIVSQFGYNGNAASIHGCFLGPDGRLYWTDGYHGHEFKDESGAIESKREGSYLFSCMPDGSDKRIHCGGGMDNPVEIDFTPSGDMLGTVNILYTRPRVDCLVHWLHGGAYPHRERVLNELKVTGDLLGPAHRFGHVAVSGMTRYRSGTLDYRFGDHWFTTFFNSGKVVRLQVVPDGSTYKAVQHEFLSSPSREFHPTDVIEDADGSLLVIDTGGWFYRGCPTSQFAKPDLLGGIYRVKRDGMTAQVDPRGMRIDWKSQSPAQLTKLFNDTRFAVRRRAVDEAVKRGEELLPTLKSLVVRADIRVRQNCVSALSQLVQRDSTSESAAAALRLALSDRLPLIRQAAVRSFGFSASKVDSSWIIPLLNDESPSVRRQTAATLGMMADPAAVKELVKALGRKDLDRSEHHALTYALIEINDAKEMLRAKQKYLDEQNPVQFAGVLMALDQIDGSEVAASDFLSAVILEDDALLATAASIAKKRPEWQDMVVEIMTEELEVGDATTAGTTLLDSFIHQPLVSALAGRVLASSDFGGEAKARVKQSIAGAGTIAPHPSWIEPLRLQLGGTDEKALRDTVVAVRSLAGNHFSQQLAELSEAPKRSLSLRIDALEALAAQTRKLDQQTFDRLVDLYANSGSPLAATRSAEIIGSASLNAKQLRSITPLLEKASPTELRNLMKGFQRSVDMEVAVEFLNAIESSSSWHSLAEHELSDVIKRFPKETLPRANVLLNALKEQHQAKLKRLELLRGQLDRGDAKRGEKVFVSEKAKCTTCHQIGKQGKAVGPDLSNIGANRSSADLLESIVFPSASIVRDYESFKVLTSDGRALTGMVVKETGSELQLQQANGEIAKIETDNIEQVSPSTVSIMPAGLDQSLSEQELIDVVRYLQSQRQRSPKSKE